MIDLTNTTIRDIVTEDFRTAAVFQKYGLDFCCGGGRSISDACTKEGVDMASVTSDLETLLNQPANGTPKYNTWELDLLADYIVANHHRYVRETVPAIMQHVRKVATVHGHGHPETIRIADLFESVALGLMQHMQKEELMLFPYIKQLVAARNDGSRPAPSPFGSIANPIRMMEVEHQSAGDEMAEIRELSAGYNPPDDACTTFRVSYQELQAFEADLHQHVHLENNILFPKAIELESQLYASAAAF